jgi:hypothetical protein
MKNLGDHWYQVPEVWLMIVMLLATMVGSLALVVTAFEHRDELHQVGPVIASPLPPTAAAQPADRATP